MKNLIAVLAGALALFLVWNMPLSAQQHVQLYTCSDTGSPPHTICIPISSTNPLSTSGVAGGTTAATIADGADVAEGAKADSAWVSGSGSVIAILKNIATGISSAIAAGTNYIGQVGMSTLQSGVQASVKQCDTHAKYDASDNGSITLVTGVSAKKVYICGFILATGGTATNLKLREGSDANCVTNAADLTPAYQLVANDRIGAYGPYATGLQVSTNAYYVCINASAGNAHQAEIWYTIQ